MGKRQETREKIETQIIELGRRHLVTEGAAGLSLRAISRDLGMVSSAVYRYVASRDDLLTLLLVDAYSELADAVDLAGAAAGPGRVLARPTARNSACGPPMGG
jgi:AcrR family transcriptional regulator